jgi:hypothetical protein
MCDLSANPAGAIGRSYSLLRAGGTRRRYLYSLIVAVGAFGANFTPLSAAEISAISSSRVVLEGEILSGDYDKLRNLIDPNAYPQVGVGGIGGDWYGDRYDEIYLASPGGSLSEAMKIGRLVRALRWQTIVPSPFNTNPYIHPEKLIANLHLKNPNLTTCAPVHVSLFLLLEHTDKRITSTLTRILFSAFTDPTLQIVS